MSGDLDVILEPRLGARASQRRRQVTAGSDVPVWIDVRHEVSDAPVEGVQGVAALYWKPGTAGDESAAEPLFPTEVKPGTWRVLVPKTIPGPYTVWFGIQEPLAQVTEITFEVSSVGGVTLTATETVPWGEVQAVAAAASVSATIPVARQVADEAGAAAGERVAGPVALAAIEGDVQAVETARQQVEGHAGEAALSEQVALGAADMARDERIAATGAAAAAADKASEATGAAGAASGSAGAAASSAGAAGAAAEAAAGSATQAATTVASKVNKVNDTLTGATLVTPAMLRVMSAAGAAGMGRIPIGRTAAVDRTHYLSVINDLSPSANAIEFDVHTGTMVDAIGQTTKPLRLQGDGQAIFYGTPRYGAGVAQPADGSSFARRDFVIPADAKGAANGVAPLDGNGRLQTTRLPSQTMADEFIGGRAGSAAPAVGGAAPFWRNDLSVAKETGSDFLRTEGDYFRHSDLPGWQGIAARIRHIVGSTEMGTLEYNAADNPEGVTIGARGGVRFRFTKDGDIRAGLTKVVNVRDYGAKGDGITDDTTAFKLALEYIRNVLLYGAILFMPPGNYIVKDSLYIWMSKRLEIAGSLRGAVTLVFSGLSGLQIGLAATHATVPATRAPGLTLRNFTVRAVGAAPGPVLFESLYASNLEMTEMDLRTYLGNTAVRVGSMFNCRWINTIIWGAGVHRVRKLTPAGATFSIAKTAQTLTSAVDVFGPEDVGEWIWVSAQQLRITEVVDARTATVHRKPYQDAVDATAIFEGVRGSIAAGTKTLTLNAARYSAADVGRAIWIFDAMAGNAGARLHLRTTITDVAADGITVTVADAPTLSVTKTELALSPAMEILGGELKRTNDVVFTALHLEECKGTVLAVQEGLNVRFLECKLHAMGSADTNDNGTMLCLLWSNVEGRYSGIIEGTAFSTLGKVYVSGQSNGAKFDDIHTVFNDGGPWLTSRYNHPAGYVRIGDVFSANQVSQETLNGAIANDNSCPLESFGAVRGAYASTVSGWSLVFPIRTSSSIQAKRLIAADWPEAANDAAAATAGVAVGEVYFRTTDNALTKRRI